MKTEEIQSYKKVSIAASFYFWSDGVKHVIENTLSRNSFLVVENIHKSSDCSWKRTESQTRVSQVPSHKILPLQSPYWIDTQQLQDQVKSVRSLTNHV